MLYSGFGISSVANQLPCFGVVFTVLDYWGLVSLPCPLFLGQGQWSFSCPLAVTVLWWFADYFSIFHCCLSLAVAHWIRRWALCTAACPISGSSLSPSCCWPFCLSSLCLLKVCAETAPCPYPLLWWAFSNSAPLLYVSFQFLVYCSGFFLCRWGGGGSFCQVGYAGLS
jgi:hypothetical protein